MCVGIAGGWALGAQQAASLQRQIQAGTSLGRNGRLAVGRCAERDVDDGFELDGDALFRGGTKLPLTEGVHGIGVELVVDAANELDAVDRAVTADYGVEDDFAFDMLVDQRRRILRIDLSKRTGSGDFRGTGARA